MSKRLIRNLLAILEAEEEAAAEGSKSNHGTVSSFNNHGNGDQDFSHAKISSGAHSGDRHSKLYTTTNNYRGPSTVNNSGNFNGHGNGGFIDGDFNVPTRNHNY